MNEKATKIGRIGTILALVGSSVFVQLPVEIEKLNWVGILLFVAAFLTWISIEITGTEDGIYNGRFQSVLDEDVKKINTLIAMVDRKQFYTLKRTQIQTYMERNAYQGILDFIHYHEDDIFKFHNVKIQTEYEKFANDAGLFVSEFFDLYGSDGRGSMTWRPAGDGHVSDEKFQKIMVKIGSLDRKASTLAEQWERLIGIARNELKGASKEIESYAP